MNLIAERNLDELGRVVIPSEVRMKLGITSKTTVKVFENGGKIILEKSEPSCNLCGSTKNVNEHLKLCDECITKVKNY